MLSNPLYGKYWAGDQKYILDGKQVLDRRFEVPLKDFRGNLETVSATPRSLDGQLLFLMEMVNKDCFIRYSYGPRNLSPLK